MIAPLELPVSSIWLGNDGSWSTFNVKAGKPPQSFRVLPSFQSQTLLLPIADECAKISSDAGRCGTSRGAEPFAQRPSAGFQTNASSTWEAIGLFEMGLQKEHGITGNSFSGFDEVEFSNITLDHFPITAYASPGVWIGQLGLSPVPLNFSETISSSSLLTTLKKEKMIPSLSYGYQAGASYRQTRVPASLVLGGYDKSRATTPLTVDINEDLARALTVGLQDILVTNSLNGTLSMIATEPILASIDSSISDLWLPRSVCGRFEDAFELQYDEKSGRYALSDATRDKLRQQNPRLTFTIGTNTVTGGNTTTIQFPYAAFDQQASFPIFANSTNYFPIRRADNESQYAIGRVFLQEAYIGVDFERGIFNVSAANWNETEPDIVTISAGNDQALTKSESGNEGRNGLTGGQIAGIAIGSLAALVILCGLGWILYRRRRRERYNGSDTFAYYEKVHPRELQGTHKQELAGVDVMHEMPAKHGFSQLHETEVFFEMDRQEVAYELASNRGG